MQNHKVIIGIPMKSDKRISFGLTKFLAAHDSQIADVIPIDGTDGCINRNMIILHFLAGYSSVEHLFLIDADTSPNENAINNLLELDEDIVCGVVPISKCKKIFWNVMPTDKKICESFMPEEDLKIDSKPFTIRKTGAACLMINRKVLKSITFPYFRNDCENIGSINDFMKRRPYTAGDFYFCEQVIKHGFEIWAQPKVRCGHDVTINLLNLIKE